MKQGTNGRTAIDLDPDFQRRERWSASKQSALIESFLLNVPVPPIYLAEDEYGQYSVVDGKQRLTAIKAFMNEGLALVDLEKFGDVGGMRLEDLPDSLQNALQIRPYVRVVTLLKQSDPGLKFEVFTRLNRGGEPMLPQELRKVAYRGDLSDEIFKLALSPFLRTQLKITSSESPAFKNMDDAEYVLRFLALEGTWRTFSGSLRDELDGFMISGKNMKPAAVKLRAAKFATALDSCKKIWKAYAFQRNTGAVWRSQFLAGMYDAEMLAVNELTSAELKRAITRSAEAIKQTALLFKDKAFENSVRQGTNTPSFVRNRVNSVLDMLRAL